MGIEIRWLDENDVGSIGKLTETMVKPEVFPLTVFACSGYTDFLLAHYRVPPEWCEMTLLGVYVDGVYQGFAEWRRSDAMLLLNNFYIMPDARRAGLGARMLAHGVQLAAGLGCASVALDVFAWNADAIGWYARRGFVASGATYWHVGPNRYAGEGAQADFPFTVFDYAQAEAQHKLYGFSSFAVATGGGRHTVGRLGDHTYRLRVAADIVDEQVMMALATLDGSRSLFVLTPSEHVAGFAQLCHSLRMKLDVDGAKANL